MVDKTTKVLIGIGASIIIGAAIWFYRREPIKKPVSPVQQKQEDVSPIEASEERTKMFSDHLDKKSFIQVQDSPTEVVTPLEYLLSEVSWKLTTNDVANDEFSTNVVHELSYNQITSNGDIEEHLLYKDETHKVMSFIQPEILIELSEEDNGFVITTYLKNAVVTVRGIFEEDPSISVACAIHQTVESLRVITSVISEDEDEITEVFSKYIFPPSRIFH